MCEACTRIPCAYAPERCASTGVQTISIKDGPTLTLCDLHLDYVTAQITAAQYN